MGMRKSSPKAKKGGGVKGAAKNIAGGILDIIPGGRIIKGGYHLAGAIKGRFSKKKAGSVDAFGNPRKRHKGRVPKSVKRWIHKIVRRRKLEEKLVNGLMHIKGIKKVATKSRMGYGSPGVITPHEAREMLRR